MYYACCDYCCAHTRKTLDTRTARDKNVYNIAMYIDHRVAKSGLDFDSIIYVVVVDIIV